MRWRSVACVLWAAVFSAPDAVGASSSDPRGTPAAGSQPNVLIFYTDDQVYTALGLESGGVIKTPNLDRLAREGVRFTRFAANHPICTVSRATLQTGQYARVHGALFNNSLLNPANTTYLAEIFQRAGYRTGYTGKWHIDGGEDEFGNFILWFRLIENSWVRPSRRRGYEEFRGYECCQEQDLSFYWNDNASPPELIFTPELGWELDLQRYTLHDFVQRHTAEGEPWMYMVSVGLPHVPLRAPAEYLAMYNAADIALPEWMPLNVSEEKKQVARETLRLYYAAMSYVDAQVGAMLNDLEALGAARNTIVVFASDNGNHLGQHWDEFLYDDNSFQGKGLPNSNSIRVPLIMRWPGHMPAGEEVDELMGTVDLAPTVLSLAGLPPHWRMQGTDMSRWALGRTGPRQEALLLTHNRLIPPSWEGLWSGRYIYSAGQTRVLYDLQTDPLERNNLIDDPAVADVQAELAATLSYLVLAKGKAPEFPDIGAAERAMLDGYDEAFTREADSVLIDGMSIWAYLVLAMAAGGLDNGDEIVREAVLSAYAQNLDAFDRNDFVRARQFRQLLAVGLSASSELREFLLAAIEERLGESLAGGYVSMYCEVEGACFPVDPFTPPGAARVAARGIEEPLAGSGDLDLDGLTNAQEYANAVAAHAGIRGFVRAALDPARDGSESTSSSGLCFIGTAAYGTPLAPQLDVLRGFRDRWLLPNALGAPLVDAYYRMSPPAADWIAGHPAAKGVARFFIALSLGPQFVFAAFAIALLAIAAIFPARRRLLAVWQRR